jgi:hypothetical protein
MTMSLTWVIVARSSVSSVGHTMLKVGHSHLTKGLELCQLHPDSIVTQEAIPNISKHGLEHRQAL